MRLWSDRVGGVLGESTGTSKRKSKKAGLVAMAAAGAIGVLSQQVRATTYTWTGNTDGTTWGTNTNWNPTSGPPGSADTALFNSTPTGGVSITLHTQNWSVTNINFDTANVGAFTFTATSTHAFDLTSGGAISLLTTDTSTKAETFNLPIEFGSGTTAASYSFTNNATSTSALLNFQGEIGDTASGTNGTTGAVTLNLNGSNAGANTISGLIQNQGTGASGVITLDKSGTGLWVLSDGSNSFTGGVNITQGTLEITAAGALGTGTATVNGGTLQLGGITSTKALTFDAGSGLEGSGTSVQNAVVTLANTASGAFTLETSSTATDSFTIDSGDLSAGAATSTISVAGAGTVTLGGTNSYAGLWNLTSGTLSIGADLDLGPAPTPSAVANYLTFSGGTLKDTASMTLSSNRGIQLGTAGGTIDVASAQTLTYGGVIANVSAQTGGLTKTDTGTLLLTNTNTYSGGTTLSAGTVDVQNSAALGSGALAINGGTLDLQTGGALTAYNTTIGGTPVAIASDLAGNGAGVNYTLGTLSIGADTLDLTKGSHITSGTAGLTFGTTTLTGNPTFDAASGTALTLGALADGGTARTIVFQDSGSVTLGTAASSLVSGTGVTVSTGTTLNLNTTGALGSGTANVTDTGTLALGASQSLLSLTGAGAVNLGGNALTLNNSTTTPTISGLISGTGGSLAMSGSGTVTLSDGSNSFTGGVTVNSGIVDVTANGALGSATPVVNNGGTLQFGGITSTAQVSLKSGGAVEGSGTTAVENAAINLDTTPGDTFTLKTSSTASDVFTIDSGDITAGASTDTINIGGSGTVVLAGSNNYTGLWNLASGTLSIGNDLELGNPAPSSAVANFLTFSGGTLKDTASLTLNSNRGIQLGTSGGTIDVASGQTMNYGGIIANVTAQTGALTKTDTGTLVLSGANTYTGGTSITGGVLSISADNNLGASGGITLGGGTLNATGNVSGSRAVTLNTGTDTFNIASGMTFNETGLFTGTGALTMATGTGTLVLSNTGNSYSGGTALDSGAIDINSASAIGTGTFTIAGGNFDNTSAGALTLSHNNAQAWNSSFIFGGTQSLNMGTGAVTLGANDTVTVSGSTLTVSGIISGSGRSLTETGAGTLVLSGNSTFGTAASNTAGLIVEGTVESTSSGSATAIGLGNVTVDAGATLIGGAADSFGYNTNGTGTTFNIDGGTITDLGTSSYRITMPNLNFTGGTLSAAAGNSGDADGNYSLYGNSTSETVTTNAASTTAMISGGAISIQTATTFNIAAGTVTGGLFPGVNLAVTSNVLPFTANAGINKTGSGVMLLAGNDSYTGTTTISAGTLYMDGTNSGLGNVSIPNTITASTTLGGTGSIGLATNDTMTLTGKSGTVLAILSPGDLNTAMATLTVGTTGHNNTVTFAADSELSLGVGAGAGNNDKLAVVGTLNTSSTSDILALNEGSLDQGKYTLMTYTTLSHGTNTAANGGFASVNLTGVSNPAYHLELNTGETDLVHKETIGTITATPSFSSIITGSTDPFTYAVTNSAPSGSDSISFTSSNVSNVTGSSSGTVAAASTTSGVTGLTFNGTAPGTGDTGTFTVSDASSTNGSQNGTVTVNVLDHALASALVTAGNNFDAFVNSGALSATVNLAAAATDGGGAPRAGVQVGGTSANLSGGTIGVISAGSSSNYTAAFNAAATAGTQNVNVSFNTGDDQSIHGAGAVGTANVTSTITGSVFDHAAISNQVVTPVATQGQTVNYGYSLSNPVNGSALRDGAAVSAVSADGNGYTSGFGSPTTIGSGQSSNYTGTFTASPTAASSQVYNFTYADGDHYQGALSNETATLTVNPTVYNLAEVVPTNANAIAAGRSLIHGTTSGTNPEAGGTTNDYTIYVTDNGDGTYTTAGLSNLNGGAGVNSGYVYIQVDDKNGNPSSYGSDPIDLFFNFNSGGSLNNLESDLTAFNYTWYDASGNYGTDGVQSIGNSGDLNAVANYQLEVVVPSVAGDPVLDFDFSNPNYGGLTVNGLTATSIEDLPEPATSIMITMSAMGVLLKRRRRTIGK
jgi:fibronectin-binding autotransporter adhesin